MTEQSRSPLRFLAPVALLAFAAVFYLMVAGSGLTPLGGGEASTPTQSSGGQSKAETASSPAEERRARRRERAERRRSRRRSYRVRPGDTVGAIAQKTGLPADRIQELNPDLDPQTLAPGQTIKLRE